MLYIILNSICFIALGLITALIYNQNKKNENSIISFVLAGLIIFTADILFTAGLLMSKNGKDYLAGLIMRGSLGMEGAFIVFFFFSLIENKKECLNQNFEMIKYVLSGFSIFFYLFICKEIIVSMDSGIIIASKRIFPNKTNNITFFSIYYLFYKIVIPILCCIFRFYSKNEKSFFSEKYKTLILAGLFLILTNLKRIIPYHTISFELLNFYDFLILLLILYIFIQKKNQYKKL